MKKQTIFLFTALFLLLSTQSALAVSDTSINKRDRDQVQAQTNQDLNNSSQEISPPQVRTRQQTENQSEDTQIQVRQEVQSRLTQVKQNLVNRVYNNIKNQLNRRFQVLESSQVKIQSRLTQMTQEGKDVSLASDKLAQVEPLKEQYRAQLQILAGQIDEINQSEQPFNQVPALRQTAKQIGGFLKQIRQIQVDAIKLIISLND